RLRDGGPLIAPSMLKCDFSNLQRELNLLEDAQAHVLHFDVMDGHFVPNLSYGALVIESLRATTPLFFDAHLMIANPEPFVRDYLQIGCDLVTFHIEAVPEPRTLLTQIRETGAAAGLALNPQTPAETIRPFLSDCDLILVMSVEPGFGGQKFLPESSQKIQALRSWSPPSTVIAVDGGICESTIAETARAGCEFFVVGSSIFGSADYTATIRSLKGIAVQ
ncbi:MAG: ribulose-phosphate 3-epimerase, partial [Planctomycetaceae bacterium]